MIKFKNIKFINHEILGNLALDFTLPDGSVADTVIIAGENGTGKSTILDILYTISANHKFPQAEIEYELENDSLAENNKIKLAFVKYNQTSYEKRIVEPYFPIGKWQEKFPTNAIFADVSINFNGNNINSVTSQNLDTSSDSKKSNANISNQINQLIVDIQALDDSELASIIRQKQKNNEDLNSIKINERLNRFKSAFNYMFDNLKYVGVDNRKDSKVILFSKYGKEFSIDQLSSGEKQIVYRGCFLLRDINAMKGATVFIDEPEISMHPVWQKKIMGFYRNIFKDENGRQTSQIFAVTHSPFVIHDETLDKTKIIILKRNENGEIIVSNEHKYYKCGSIETIKEAFNISDFEEAIRHIKNDKTLVITEGQTDWRHMKAALKKLKEVNPNDYKNFDIDFLEYNSKNSEKGEKSDKLIELEINNKQIVEMCRYYSKILQNHKMIFIADADDLETSRHIEGKDKHFKSWGNNVYSFVLPVPEHRKDTPNISIEHYYTDNVIKTEIKVGNNNKRLYMGNEFSKNGFLQSDKSIICKDRNNCGPDKIHIIDSQSGKEVLNGDDEKVNLALSKMAFAEAIYMQKPEFANVDFSSFKLLFDVIKEIEEIPLEENK